MLNALWHKHRQFLLYCVCGGSGVCTDFLIYHLLLELIGRQGANAAGYLAGTLLSFSLNRVLTFNMRDQTSRRLALFLLTAGIGYLASAALLALLAGGLHLNERLAKLLTLPLVVVLQFALNKRLAFKGAGQ